MIWKDSTRCYGAISKFLHWFMALLIVALFALGVYMTSLDYYHPWYRQAPDLHRSFGALAGILLLLRLLWRLMNTRPRPFGAPWERVLGRLVHRLFYVVLFAIVISGYLITTADGQPVFVFDWFPIPATITVTNQEDIAGLVHEFLAYFMILLLVIHAAASLKHHFVDKDPTLLHMLVTKNTEQEPSTHPEQES